MQPFTHLNTLESLTKHDFVMFYSRFRYAVEEKIPQFNDLFFVDRTDALSAFSLSAKVKKTIENFLKRTGNKEKLLYSSKQTILFSLTVGEGEIVAVVKGVDEYFGDRVSIDWLAELSDHLQNSFVLIKKAGTDLETELPNNQCFFSNLQDIVMDSLPSLLLIELYPRARSAHEAQIHTAKSTRSLASCLNNRIPFYYLGNHVFALLSTAIEKTDFQAIGKRILAWLRRDGFRKVHIGLCCREDYNLVEKSDLPRDLFEQVNFALQAARKRGPFALCDYQHLSKPDEHPLRKPSKVLLAKFRRRWKHIDSFSVAELQSTEKQNIDLLIRALPEENMVDVNENGVYLFFPHTPPDKVQKTVKSWLDKEKLQNILTGVAYYPHLSFTKSSTVFHCRKAINHAAFYGPNGSAIFDEVSLNVSGDIYYAEGDLTLAVKEYKTGITCDPQNVNLLNSLGVVYADMDKHRDAQRCFAKVLDIENDNFMALYNSGLEAELTGRPAAALGYFTRAHAITQIDEEIEADLTYHLGRLLCLEERHQEAVDILRPWYQDHSESRTKERALPYLGRSYYGLQKYAEAAEWLQRALQYNEFDGESMGLLGLCYLLLEEGNDIALTLCRKSVELEPDNKILRIYLARVQIACNLHKEAGINLGKCLRIKKTRTEAQLLSALNYLEQGLTKRAEFWLAKLSTNDNIEWDMAARVRELKEEIHEI
ncbi:MAG: tetratricopeptide repeat protein [Desulfocapsaceae bacterium]|nr:tetratricopeptide repeat protein [Desulfocapsaceae bacterium]